MKRYAQSYFEILKFYPSFKLIKPIPISDQEASTLYDMWAKSPPGHNKIEANGDEQIISSLSSKGYIRAATEGIEITDKGRAIIVEMVTNAPNALGSKPMPTYRQIKLKADQQKSLTKRSIKK